MAKLYFRYGAMNSGKTTALMQVAYNYKERGMDTIVIKPMIDTKGNNKIVSRLGIEKEVDILIGPNDDLMNKLNSYLDKISCILVDEAQFMTKKHIDELFYISKQRDIPVICYGLRSDFKTDAFPGSLRLFELADELEELITICRCGKRAKFNGRKVNGIFVFEGDQVAIDEENSVTYESLCGECYIEKVQGKVIVKKIK
jgi:thymidine kinase